MYAKCSRMYAVWSVLVYVWLRLLAVPARVFLLDPQQEKRHQEDARGHEQEDLHGQVLLRQVLVRFLAQAQQRDRVHEGPDAEERHPREVLGVVLVQHQPGPAETGCSRV